MQNITVQNQFSFSLTSKTHRDRESAKKLIVQKSKSNLSLTFVHRVLAIVRTLNDWVKTHSPARRRTLLPFLVFMKWIKPHGFTSLFHFHMHGAFFWPLQPWQSLEKAGGYMELQWRRGEDLLGTSEKDGRVNNIPTAAPFLTHGASGEPKPRIPKTERKTPPSMEKREKKEKTVTIVKEVQ